MTKKYIVNGVEIQGITKGELSHLASKHRRLWYILRKLLEALSDKEEDYSYLDNLEQISHCCKAKIFFKGAGNGLWCSSCKKEVFHTEYVEEPKQEECNHVWQSSTKLTRSCEKCAVVEPKQSTSLKEVPLRDKIDFIQDRLLNDHITTEQSITEILELIQSHLLKEINQRELAEVVIGENYGDVKQGFDYAKYDIIKIINNIK